MIIRMTRRVAHRWVTNYKNGDFKKRSEADSEKE